jgi:hypothetical protein
MVNLLQISWPRQNTLNGAERVDPTDRSIFVFRGPLIFPFENLLSELTFFFLTKNVQLSDRIISVQFSHEDRELGVVK